MDYHKVTRDDCLSVATKKEKIRLSLILDLALTKDLARRWCAENNYRLGGYLGRECWDTISLEQKEEK